MNIICKGVLVTIIVVVNILMAAVYGSCGRAGAGSGEEIQAASDSIRMSVPPRPLIGGHECKDTIVGNFTGKGMDSIWVVERIDTVVDGYAEYNYHTQSNNPLLPSVELYGRPSHCAFIVNEGDVDGDGQDEWAWMRGNFRSDALIDYHLLHFDGKKWLECTFDLDKDTREADIDVVKRGPVENSIIISFLYWGEEASSGKVLGQDTVFNPFCDTAELSDFGDK